MLRGARKITSQVFYDASIRKDYEERNPNPWNPSRYFIEHNDDWAIIPTHRAKSYHDPFYFKDRLVQPGLPESVAKIFLTKDIVTDSGYALVFKRVIGLKSQDGNFYNTNIPKHIGLNNEVWGDYYYAGYFSSILHALNSGCKRLAVFPTHGGFYRWQWCALIRATHNAVLQFGSRLPLLICDICVSGLPDFAQKEEAECKIQPHSFLENLKIDNLNDEIQIIKFLPSKFSSQARVVE